MTEQSELYAGLVIADAHRAIFTTSRDLASQTLGEIIPQVMAEYPQAVAIDHDGDQLTYGQFAAVLDEQLTQLQQAGIGRGDRVGIFVPSGSFQVYVAILAVVLAGATYVPVDMEDGHDYAHTVWEATQVTAVYQPDLTLSIRSPGPITADARAPMPDDEVCLLAAGDKEALRLTPITHAGLAAIIEGQAVSHLRGHPLGPGDRIMTRLSVASLPAVKEMWLAWRTGATLVPAPCEVATSAEKLPAWISQQAITTAAVVPSMAHGWPHSAVEQVRLLILIGQDIPAEDVERLCQPGREIWTGFPQTFTAARLYDGLQPTTDVDSVGLPIPGMHLAVVGADDEPVAWGMIGEVVVAGPALPPHLAMARKAGELESLPSLGWEQAYRTGVQVRAERTGLILAQEDNAHSHPAATTHEEKQEKTRPVLQVPLIQIDAFAEDYFQGNPAAVMHLPEWLPDEVLQQVARENNLSETAFVVDTLPTGIQAPEPGDPSYHLRWFTPAVEVDLCGHATLAAASYLFDDVHPEATTLQFHTRSGWLFVTRSGDGRYTMDLPSEVSVPVEIDPEIAQALGAPVSEAFQATDLIYLVEDPQTVIDLAPDLSFLAQLPVRGIIVTAPDTGTEYDFVSRWFGAQAGISEDPVTGSAHCQLAPLWAKRLGKQDMVARQVSARGGTVHIYHVGQRTLLTGRCVRFMEATATVPREDIGARH